MSVTVLDHKKRPMVRQRTLLDQPIYKPAEPTSGQGISTSNSSLPLATRQGVTNTVPCPRCGSPAGEPCVGDGGGQRRNKKNHAARVREFRWSTR